VATWKPARFELVLDGNVRVYSGLVGRRVQLKGVRRRHVRRAHTPSSTTALLDVVVCERTSRFTFVFRVLPRCSRGTHVELPYVHELRRARGHGERRPTRSRCTPTATRWAISPVTVRVRPGALTMLVP
jgi:hypothetical protein